MSVIDQDMSLLSRLVRNRWFQAASALGVVLGIASFFIGLPPVAEWAFGKKVSLSLNVISQIPVFAVRQPVPGLSVQLNSQDLTQTKRDLVASRIQLKNDGEISVNARNTTTRDPLGFRVVGGDVVRLYQRSANSEHLRKLAVPQVKENTFTLPPGLIIDPGDYIQFDLLIVRPVNKNITFESLGKVEGLARIRVGRPDTSTPVPSAAYTAWSGGILPQLLRVLTYPFIAVAIIALVIVTGYGVSDQLSRMKRKKRESFVAKSLSGWEEKDPKLRKLVPALYAATGLHELTRLTDDAAVRRRAHFRKDYFLNIEKGSSKILNDFEASSAIDNSLSDYEASHYAVDNLLDSLSLRDSSSRKIDERLKLSIISFSKALTNSVSAKDIRRNDPQIEPDIIITSEEGLARVRSPE